MPKLIPVTESQQARPIPDPDSLAMDDRGTRIYRDTAKHPGQRHVPDDGNYTGDPNKPAETIRANDDGGEEVTDAGGSDQELPSSADPAVRDSPQ